MFAFFTLFVQFVATTILIELISPKPKIDGAKAASLSDFNLPTATEERSVPVLFGTYRIFPAITWYGDFVAQAVNKRVKTGLISSKSVTIGYKYKIGMLLMLTQEKCSKILKVFVNDNVVAYDEEKALTDAANEFTTIQVRASTGGPNQEVQDGVDAEVRIYAPKTNPELVYTPDPYLTKDIAGFIGPGRMPRYPNKTYAVWLGPTHYTENVGTVPPPTSAFGDKTLVNYVYDRIATTRFGSLIRAGLQRGFVGTSPRVPSISFLMQRMPSQETIFEGTGGFSEPPHPAQAFISDYIETVQIGNDANPAWIIVEALRNRVWGAGLAAAFIDFEAFAKAARVLKTEGNGASFVFETERTFVELFEVLLRQINGVIVRHPGTGSVSIKLIRNTDEPVADVDESDIISIDSFERKAEDSLISEVKVPFVDAENKFKSRVAKAFNSAMIASTGRVLSTTLTFPTCSNELLARTLALRELRALTTKLAVARLKIKGNPARIYEIGDCIRLSSSFLRLVNVRFRISTVRYNKNLTVAEIEAVQDVFGDGSNLFGGDVTQIEYQDLQTPAPITEATLELAPYEMAPGESQSLMFYARFNNDNNTRFFETLSYSNPEEILEFEQNLRPSALCSLAQGLPASETLALLVLNAQPNVFKYLKEALKSETIVKIGSELILVGTPTFDELAGTVTFSSYKRAIYDTLPASHPEASSAEFVIEVAVEPDPVRTIVPADSNVFVNAVNIDGLTFNNYRAVSSNGVYYSDLADTPDFVFDIANYPRLRAVYPNPLGYLRVNGTRPSLDGLNKPFIQGSAFEVEVRFRNRKSLAKVSYFEDVSNREPGADAWLELYVNDTKQAEIFTTNTLATFENLTLEPGDLVRIDVRTRLQTEPDLFIYSAVQSNHFIFGEPDPSLPDLFTAH